MPQNRKKRPFSLLEILITISLIVLIGGVTVWSLQNMLHKQRFNSEMEEFKNLLEELQIEALALKSDMELELYKDSIWKARSRTGEKILKPRVIELKTVEKIFLREESQAALRLKISSTGDITPHECLGLKSSQEALFVDLRKPIQIKFLKEYPTDTVSQTCPEKPMKKRKKNGPE